MRTRTFCYLYTIPTGIQIVQIKHKEQQSKQNTLPSLDLCSSGTSATRHSKKGFWQKPSRSNASGKKTSHFFMSFKVTLGLNNIQNTQKKQYNTLTF